MQSTTFVYWFYMRKMDENDRVLKMYFLRASKMGLATSILLIFYTFYFLVYYPVITDGFDFWHMAFSIKGDELGHIDGGNPFIGFYVLTIILSTLTNLEYVIIPQLPLVSLAYIFLILIVLIHILHEDDNFYYLFIIIAISVLLLRFGNQGSIGWWGHGVAFIISLTTLYAIILKINRDNNQSQLSLIILLCIISLNYISYKQFFFIISILFVTHITGYLPRLNINSSQSDLKNILSISIIFSLFFNEFFYDGIVPKMRIAAEGAYLTSIDRLLVFFRSDSIDLLYTFYYRLPADIIYCNIFFLLILLLGQVLFILMILNKTRRNMYISFNELFVLVFVAGSWSILILYTFFGLVDFSFIPISSILCYASLYANSPRLTRICILNILLLLLSNIYVTIIYTQLNYYEGIKNTNNFEYIKSSFDWFIEYDLAQSQALSDVITSGFFLMEAYKSGNFNVNIKELSRERMEFLLLHSDESEIIRHYEFFIINKKLHRFSTSGWLVFPSWTNFCKLLNGNVNLNKVYSSDNIDFYTTRISKS